MCKVSIEIGWNRKIIHQNLGKSPERVPVTEVERWSHKWFGCYLRLWRGSHSRCAEIFNHVGAGQTPRRNVVEEWNAQCPVFAAPHFPGGIGMNSNEIIYEAHIYIYIYHINLQRQVKDLRHLVSQCLCQQGWPHVLCCSVYSAWCVDIVKFSVCYAAWILVKIPTRPSPLEHQPSWRGHEIHESLDLFGATSRSSFSNIRLWAVWSWFWGLKLIIRYLTQQVISIQPSPVNMTRMAWFGA